MLLDLIKLHDKYNMCVTGVLHIGAHFGEENKIYDMLEYPNRVFFEPLLKNYENIEPIIEYIYDYRVPREDYAWLIK